MPSKKTPPPAPVDRSAAVTRGMQSLAAVVFSLPVQDMLEVSPERAKDIKTGVWSVLESLSSREQQVILLRFGLDGEGVRTLRAIGEIYGRSTERIRQIEAKALRKVRHPSRSYKVAPLAFNEEECARREAWGKKEEEEEEEEDMSPPEPPPSRPAPSHIVVSPTNGLRVRVYGDVGPSDDDEFILKWMARQATANA